MPVSFVIGSGIARGEGLGAAAATSAPETTAPTVVVTATAPTPAALMKFLREYSIFKPPYKSRGYLESRLERHLARSSADLWNPRGPNPTRCVRFHSGMAPDKPPPWGEGQHPFLASSLS